MTYRDATPWGPTGRVVHGPFPVRLGRLALGLPGLFAAPLFLVMAFSDGHLDCNQKTDRCHYEEAGLVRQSLTFALHRVRGVRVEIKQNGKTRSGVPYVELDDRELALADVSVDEAQRFADRLKQALARKPATLSLDLEAERAALVPAGFFVLLTISALFAALRSIGRVLMSAEGGTLRLTRSIFGVPTWRGEVDLRGVTDVEVEWEHRKSFWTQRFSAGDTYGRLVLVRGTEREPLTRAAFPGYHLHRRAEHALRELLALSPRTPAQEAAQAARASAYAPPPILGGPGGTIFLVWIGVCVGALAGFPLGWLLLRPFGLAGDRSPSDAVFAIGVPLGVALGITTAFALRRRAATR
jgi:hypothetical protein